jgi:hypothetical protein
VEALKALNTRNRVDNQNSLNCQAVSNSKRLGDSEKFKRCYDSIISLASVSCCFIYKAQSELMTEKFEGEWLKGKFKGFSAKLSNKSAGDRMKFMRISFIQLFTCFCCLLLFIHWSFHNPTPLSDFQPTLKSLMSRMKPDSVSIGLRSFYSAPLSLLRGFRLNSRVMFVFKLKMARKHIINKSFIQTFINNSRRHSFWLIRSVCVCVNCCLRGKKKFLRCNRCV